MWRVRRHGSRERGLPSALDVCGPHRGNFDSCVSIPHGLHGRSTPEREPCRSRTHSANLTEGCKLLGESPWRQPHQTELKRGCPRRRPSCGRDSRTIELPGRPGGAGVDPVRSAPHPWLGVVRGAGREVAFWHQGLLPISSAASGRCCLALPLVAVQPRRPSAVYPR